MSTEMSLVGTTGRAIGSRPSGRLRTQDQIPAVVYGQGVTPISIAVSRRDLRQALTGPAGLNALINLTVDGVSRPTVVKDLQRDPVKRNVRHVDFLVVDVNEKVSFDVHLVVTGESEEVKRLEGAITLNSTTVKVLATPSTVPTELVIDVSEMGIGDQFTAGQLTLPEGVELLTDPEHSVLSAAPTRATLALQQGLDPDALDEDLGGGGGEPADGGEAADGEPAAEASDSE